MKHAPFPAVPHAAETRPTPTADVERSMKDPTPETLTASVCLVSAIILYPTWGFLVFLTESVLEMHVVDC